MEWAYELCRPRFRGRRKGRKEGKEEVDGRITIMRNVKNPGVPMYTVEMERRKERIISRVMLNEKGGKRRLWI